MTISEQYATKLGELNDELEAGNAELRAEIERLTKKSANYEVLAADIVDKQVEIERLTDEAADQIGRLNMVLNYVADMTYCGTDAEWHFKLGYDPQVVLDALEELKNHEV